MKSTPNLTKSEQETMKKLSLRDEVIIINPDRGGAAVNLDSKNYTAEYERQLNDTCSFKILENDPTQKNNKLVNQRCNRTIKNDN